MSNLSSTAMQFQHETKAILKELIREQIAGIKFYPEILNIEQVSDITGYSKKTIYKMKCLGAIPSYSPHGKGGKVFFKRDEIYQWLTSRKNPTIDSLTINF